MIIEPKKNCNICLRLSEFREENIIKYPDYHNKPVVSFGSLSSQLLIVGLAPGIHGANKTGRPFTGDYAGILLYNTLIKFKFAIGSYSAEEFDTLKLKDYKFSHGKSHKINNTLRLHNSYHCSRYNTNTNRLSKSMFEDVFKKINLNL